MNRNGNRVLSLLERPSLNEKVKDEIKMLLKETLDWKYILEMARKERTSALLYQNLTEIRENGNVPPDIFREFRMDYYTNAARNIFVYRELENILHALCGIRIVILKGGALAQDVYHNIALRPMMDIDILIRKDDLREVDEKLFRLGYCIVNRFEIGGERYYIKRGIWPVLLDIHWDTWQYRADVEEVSEIRIGSITALTLSPEGLLLSIVTHSAIHHGSMHGIWVVDIAKIIENYRDRFNWDKFIKKVKAYDVDVVVYYILNYLKRHLDLDIPSDTLHRLRPSGARVLGGKIYQYILNREPVADTSHILYPLAFRGIYRKIGFLFSYIFPSPDFLRKRYRFSGYIKLPLYYAIRVFSLLDRFIKLILQIRDSEKRVRID